MTTLRNTTLALTTLATLSFGLLGCGSDEPSCEDVVKHALSLMPDEFKENANNADMLAQCKKGPKEARVCAMKAKDLAGLAACAPKE